MCFSRTLEIRAVYAKHAPMEITVFNAPHADFNFCFFLKRLWRSKNLRVVSPQAPKTSTTRGTSNPSRNSYFFPYSVNFLVSVALASHPGLSEWSRFAGLFAVWLASNRIVSPPTDTFQSARRVRVGGTFAFNRNAWQSESQTSYVDG